MREQIIETFCMNCECMREHEWGAGNYHCMSCGDTVTESEYDREQALIKDYQLQYEGAKRAGLIKRDDGEYV